MMEIIKEIFGRVNCGDHPVSIKEEDLEGCEVICALGRCSCNPYNENYYTCGSYCDSDSFAIVKLNTGKFLAMEEWSDTTGHGCQCDGAAKIFDTLQDAIDLGIGEDHREVYREEKE